MLLSKVAIAAGIAFLAAYLVGAIWLNSVAVIGAMAAVIGGVVVFGSNLTTSRQATSAMAALERHRAELIDTINLRTIGEGDQHSGSALLGGVGETRH
jgi:biotin transporter BioY